MYNLLIYDGSVSAANRGESAGADRAEPQRLTHSVVHPEDANEISGGRTNTHKLNSQRRKPHKTHLNVEIK